MRQLICSEGCIVDSDRRCSTSQRRICTSCSHFGRAGALGFAISMGLHVRVVPKKGNWAATCFRTVYPFSSLLRLRFLSVFCESHATPCRRLVILDFHVPAPTVRSLCPEPLPYPSVSKTSKTNQENPSIISFCIHSVQLGDKRLGLGTKSYPPSSCFLF